MINPLMKVIRGKYNTGCYIVEDHDYLLQVGDARVVKMFVGGHLIEALGDGRLLSHEALLHLDVELRHLLEHELDIGIHGSKLGLLAACVMDRFQDVIGSILLIPLVNKPEGNWGRRSTSKRSEEEESSVVFEENNVLLHTLFLTLLLYLSRDAETEA
jgi:hypothetical protein